jgi:hypothetical protein
MPKDSKYYQGRFHPQNPEKYIGDPSNIIYRSSWELKFMKWCDRTSAVLRYGSEEFSIPYWNPVKEKVCRYYPDFLIEVLENDGKKHKYLIEVKPKKSTLPPKPRSRTTKSYITEVQTYAVNQSKWQAAREFCKDNMIEFKVITEDELGLKG